MEYFFQILLGISITVIITAVLVLIRQFTIIGQTITRFCQCLFTSDQVLPQSHLDQNTLKVHYNRKTEEVTIDGIPAGSSNYDNKVSASTPNLIFEQERKNIEDKIETINLESGETADLPANTYRLAPLPGATRNKYPVSTVRVISD